MYIRRHIYLLYMQIFFMLLAQFTLLHVFFHTTHVLYTDLLSDIFILVDKYYITTLNHITHIDYTQYYIINVNKELTPWCNQHVFHVVCITSIDWYTSMLYQAVRIPWGYTHPFIVSNFFLLSLMLPNC